MDTSPAHRRVTLVAGQLVDDELDVSALETAGFVVGRRYELQNCLDEGTVASGLHGSWAVVAGGEVYSRAVLSALPGLRVIARVGVGYDRVDVAAATEFGKVVVITPNTIEPAVAEWTLAIMLAARRRLIQADRAVRSGQWTLPDILSPSLVGATVGLVGLGRIGREVAAQLAGFGCTIVGTDPAVASATWADCTVKMLPLDALLQISDVVSLHLPLTPVIRHIIGAREIALMRTSAIIINTSRGGLIDEAALVSAIRAGRLAGAGLDTFEVEPLPATSPLLHFDNVIVSGHVAYATHAAARASAQAAIDVVAMVARGEKPAGIINPEVPSNAIARVGADRSGRDMQ